MSDQVKKLPLPVETSTHEVCKYCQDHPNWPITARYRIELPHTIKSQNRAAANRINTSYARERDMLASYLAALRYQFGVPRAKKARRVIVTRLWGKRKRAYDRPNLVGGCKMLLDALALAGWIVDDGPVWVRDHYQQRRNPDGDSDATVIEIAEFPDGCPNAPEDE